MDETQIATGPRGSQCDNLAIFSIWPTPQLGHWNSSIEPMPGGAFDFVEDRVGIEGL